MWCARAKINFHVGSLVCVCVCFVRVCLCVCMLLVPLTVDWELRESTDASGERVGRAAAAAAAANCCCVKRSSGTKG